jgi:hypothetical protein
MMAYIVTDQLKFEKAIKLSFFFFFFFLNTEQIDTKRQMTTGISVKRATKELEVKQSIEITAKPETCTKQNTCQHYT